MKLNVYCIRYHTVAEKYGQKSHGEQATALVAGTSEAEAVATLGSYLNLHRSTRLEVISASQERSGVIFQN